MKRYYLLALISFFFVSCLTTPTYVPTVRHTLDPSLDIPLQSTLPLTLAVRPVESARPFRQQMWYREQTNQLYAYSNAEWAELPSEVFTRALIDAIRKSNRFQDVGNIFDVGNPNLILITKLRRFEEVRNPSLTETLCEATFELRTLPDRKVIWTEIISASHPLPSPNNAATFALTMNKTTGEVISRAVQKIASLPLENYIVSPPITK